MVGEKVILVRKATQKEIQAVVDLSIALFREDAGQRDPFMNLNWPRQEGKEYYTGMALGEDSVCLIAEVDGAVVGFLTGYTSKPDSLRPVQLAELESMFVEREFRGQQVGTRLATGFLAWCQEKGAQRVSVTAYASNVRAVEFYRRLGFEPRNVTLEMSLEDLDNVTSL